MDEKREKGTGTTDTYTGLEIAVIGMACRFPGARNINEFWENLKNGVESITFFPDEELKAAGTSSQVLANPNYVKAKGLVEKVEYFDPDFFNFTPKEAELMDPQLRIFLQCAWEALEDASYEPGNYKGLIGIYAGSAPNHHWTAKTYFHQKNSQSGPAVFESSLLNDYFSLRVSYSLDLRGPSVTLQTACSTSLVAIHTACMALLSCECDMALAGGVSVILPVKSGYLYQEKLIFSPDGHCRAFDAEGRGTVFSDGTGVVVLKRFEDALADRDYIRAVIKGTAINNDGVRKVGFTAPSVQGQADVISAAYSAAGVNTEFISYIETHGTATEMGDPVEIEALKMVFHSSPGNKKSCAVGSVKTNIGHLNTAAGVAGFIKTVLALEHQLIPPSLHYKTPNPNIDFENSPFYVNTRPLEWKTSGYPLRSGVSSFGLGGTNAHVVLEQAPVIGHSSLVIGEKRKEKKYQLIILSAKTQSALDKMTENLAEYFKKNFLNRGNHENPSNPGPTLADAAYTLQTGRKAFQCRKIAVCASVEEAVSMLSTTTKKVKTFFSKVKPKVIFMFPGQGSQYVNMGVDLYRTEAVFREEMNRCFEILKPMMGCDPKEILYPGDSLPDNSPLERGAPEGRGVSKLATCTLHLPPNINQTEIAQPLLFTFEYALARLLMKWGIQPTAMIGHSIGEYTSACLSGVFSLENALKLVVSRGKLMQQMPPGAMISVSIPEKQLEPLLELTDELSLAAVNSPSRCTVSGPAAVVDDFEKELKTKGYEVKHICISHAFHSKMMDSCLGPFERKLSQTRLNKPEIPFISNVSGNWITAEQAIEPTYWARQLRYTVRFADGIDLLLKLGDCVFVEVGPGRVLSSFAAEHPHRKTLQEVINLTRHQKEKIPDDYFLFSQIGHLWGCGVNIHWSEFHGGEKRYRVPLPTYPFEGQCYWIDSDPFTPGAALLTGTPGAPSLSAPSQKEEKPAHVNDNDKAGPMDNYTNSEVDPRDDVEQAVLEVYRQFLGHRRISIYDNFFDLHGDSLTATRILARLQEIYPVEVPLESFFEEPTTAHLASLIKERLLEKVNTLSEEELKNLI